MLRSAAPCLAARAVALPPASARLPAVALPPLPRPASGVLSALLPAPVGVPTPSPACAT